MPCGSSRRTARSSCIDHGCAQAGRWRRRCTAGTRRSRPTSSGITRAAVSAATFPAIRSRCCGCRTSLDLSRRNRPDELHGVELSRLRYRQYRKPRGRLSAQLPPGLRVRRRRRGSIGHYYPLVHCGTSFGNYKEVRIYLIQSPKLRESVTKILGKLGRLVDGKLLIPEEVVHYSEWVHVMRAHPEAPGRRRSQYAPRFIRPATSTRWCRRTRSTTMTSRREPRRRLDRSHADARRAGDRLQDLVRLLRLWLPPHHLRARVHAFVRH